MLAELRCQLRPALVFLAGFTILCGLIYPLAVTGAAAAFFSDQARGSLLEKNGKLIGSRLIGQPFDDPKYFWGRPSATAPDPYHGGSSSGSNLGPLHPALQRAVKDRVARLKAADPAQTSPPPVDLVTASASGLDPHISPAAAGYQVGRVARARGLPPDRVQALVQQYTAGRTLGILGEPRVNVLLLNMALDELR